MPSQIFVVVEYPNGHRHVAPLHPMALTDDSARVLARQIAEEGTPCGHCKIGDRITYAAIEARDTAHALETGLRAFVDTIKEN